MLAETERRKQKLKPYGLVLGFSGWAHACCTASNKFTVSGKGLATGD